MSRLEEVVIVVIALYVFASPFLAAWFAVRMCSRHWQCPIEERRRVDEWARKLEGERGA